MTLLAERTRRPVGRRRPERRSERRAPAPLRVLAFLLLAAGSLVALAPFAWMVATSFKQPQDVFTSTPHLLPTTEEGDWAGTLANYTEVFELGGFGGAFLNSVLVVAVLIPLKVFCSALAAYAFARIPFPGRDRLFAALLATIMLPSVALLVPKVYVTQRLGMADSLTGLIVPSLVSAFDIFLLRQFFLTHPKEVEEAAMMDGAGRLRIFWSIALPMARPALAVVTISAFIFHWNDLLWPLVILSDQDKYTLPLALQALASGRVAQPHLVMAGAVVAVMPVILIFLIFQRRILDGIQFTGLK